MFNIYFFIGLRKLQGLTAMKATAAVFIPYAVAAFLVGLLLLYTALPY
ncbi:MAG TPA: hypothetical protein VIO11_03360 [Candidatus Methanoperedens sp.]